MAQKKTRSRSAGSMQTRWLAGFGLLFVLGTFTILVRECATAGRPLANISIHVDEILPSSHGFLVSLKIRNAGTATAAALTVEGVLKQGEATLETSAISVDYVAAGSERKAALFFSKDPRLGQLTVRPKGYIEP